MFTTQIIMISSLTYFLQNRKGKLTTYLNNNIDELAIERQHQLYGAIEELDLIMNTLQNHKTNEMKNETNPDEIFLFRPIHGKGVFKTVTNFFKDLF